jgi:hypothetical protein
LKKPRLGQLLEKLEMFSKCPEPRCRNWKVGGSETKDWE